MIIYISTLCVGYFFSQVHIFEQRAVDAGLVLANIVNYPDDISPMREYFVKSWTSLHQISKIFLNFNWSFESISKLIIFVTTILYFIGIFLTINSTPKSIVISILTLGKKFRPLRGAIVSSIKPFRRCAGPSVVV